MASQLNSGTNLYGLQGTIYHHTKPMDQYFKNVYFSRQGKGVFVPISEEEMMSTKKFWMLCYRHNKVQAVEYVIRDKHGDCKIFTQCQQNLPKGIEAVLFLMGINF